MYAAWIQIDETLPWIELKGTYQTRREAVRAGRQTVSGIRIKIVGIPEKRSTIKAIATTRT